jgi:hypothetical protein
MTDALRKCVSAGSSHNNGLALLLTHTDAHSPTNYGSGFREHRGAGERIPTRPRGEHVGGNASVRQCVGPIALISKGTGTDAHSSASVDLEALARRVVRLSPDRRDPEQFHMEKSELAAELRRLARRWRAG